MSLSSMDIAKQHFHESFDEDWNKYVGGNCNVVTETLKNADGTICREIYYALENETKTELLKELQYRHVSPFALIILTSLWNSNHNLNIVSQWDSLIGLRGADEIWRKIPLTESNVRQCARDGTLDEESLAAFCTDLQLMERDALRKLFFMNCPRRRAKDRDAFIRGDDKRTTMQFFVSSISFVDGVHLRARYIKDHIAENDFFFTWLEKAQKYIDDFCSRLEDSTYVQVGEPLANHVYEHLDTLSSNLSDINGQISLLNDSFVRLRTFIQDPRQINLYENTEIGDICSSGSIIRLLETVQSRLLHYDRESFRNSSNETEGELARFKAVLASIRANIELLSTTMRNVKFSDLDLYTLRGRCKGCSGDELIRQKKYLQIYYALRDENVSITNFSNVQELSESYSVFISQALHLALEEKLAHILRGENPEIQASHDHKHYLVEADAVQYVYKHSNYRSLCIINALFHSMNCFSNSSAYVPSIQTVLHGKMYFYKYAMTNCESVKIVPVSDSIASSSSIGKNWEAIDSQTSVLDLEKSEDKCSNVSVLQNSWINNLESDIRNIGLFMNELGHHYCTVNEFGRQLNRQPVLPTIARVDAAQVSSFLKEVERNDFNDMATLLTESYNELGVRLQRNQEALSGLTYLMFGCSKAGKSTLLGRLTTDLTRSEFISKLKQTKKRQIGELVVADGVKATTTLLNLIRVPELGNIFDMPGIGDAEDTRKAVIAILQRCLYTSLSRTKFIVVMNADVLGGPSRMQLIHNYHPELLGLFGESFFNEYIKSCYFVFTHADMLPEAINNRNAFFAGTFMDISRMPNPGLGPFFNRLFRNHVFIDYNTDDRTVVTDKLKTLIEKDGREVIPSSLNNPSTLAATGDGLNAQCLTLIKGMQEELRSKDQMSLTFSKDYKNLILEVANVERHQKDFENAVEEQIFAEKQMIDDVIKIGMNKRKLEELLVKVAEAEENVKDYENSRVEFLKVTGDLKSVEMIAFESHPNKGKGGFLGQHVEVVQVTVSRPAGICSDPAILAFDIEQFQAYVTQFNSKKTLDDALDVGRMPVTILHNSRKGINTAGVEIAPAVAQGTGWKVSGTASCQFVVAFLYEVQLSLTNKNDTIASYYTNLIAKAVQNLRDLTEANKALTQKQEMLANRIVENKEKVKKLTLEIPEKSDKFATNKHAVAQRLAKLQQSIHVTHDDLRANFVHGRQVHQLQKISEILTENNLSNNMRAQLDELRIEAKNVMDKLSSTLLGVDKQAEVLQSYSLMRPQGVAAGGGMPVPPPNVEKTQSSFADKRLSGEFVSTSSGSLKES